MTKARVPLASMAIACTCEGAGPATTSVIFVPFAMSMIDTVPEPSLVTRPSAPSGVKAAAYGYWPVPT